MRLRILCAFLIALFTLALPSLAQTGTVTFYSVKLSGKQAIKDSIVPSGSGVPFTGWVFDGTKKLAHAQGGRFMTFRIAAGEHLFSAHYHAKNAGTDAVHLDVENGGHYCVRLSAKYVSGSILVPIAYFHSKSEQVPCQQASIEAAGYRPLDIKRIDSAARATFDPSASIPSEH